MKTALDRIDFGILKHLQNNARLSNKELAAAVGLAPSSCFERVRKLQDQGTLRGFHAEVAPEVFGAGFQALIFVRLRNLCKKVVEDFRDQVSQLPQVLSLFHISGEHDYLIHAAVSEARALRNFELDAITVRPEVEHVETLLVFEHVKNQSYGSVREPSQ